MKEINNYWHRQLHIQNQIRIFKYTNSVDLSVYIKKHMNRHSKVHAFFILISTIMFILLMCRCSSNSKKAHFLNDFIKANSEKTGNSRNAISHYKRVINKAKATRNNDAIAWSYLSLSENYSDEFLLEDSKKALANAKPYIDFSINSKNGIRYFVLSGNLLHLSTEYDSSIVHYKLAESISKQLKIEDEVLFNAYFGLTYSYRYKNQFDKSLKYIYKALTVGEHKKDTNLIVVAKIQIGLSHYHQFEYQKTIELLNDILSHYDKFIEMEDRANIQTEIGMSYAGLHKYKKAEFHLLKAHAIFNGFADKKGVGESFNNRAVVDMKQEKWAESITKLKKVLLIFKKEGDDRHLHIAASNLSRCYLNLNQLDSAQFYNDLVMKHAKKTGRKLMVAEACLVNSKLSEKRNNFQAANDWLKKHYKLKNEVFSTEKTATIKELSAKYEMQKKEQSLLLAKKENKIQSTRFKFTLVIAILILALLLFLFRSIYYKNLKDKEIKLKEHQLLQSRLQIAESDLKLKETELLNLTSLISRSL